MVLAAVGAVALALGAFLSLSRRSGGAGLAEQERREQQARNLPEHRHYGNADQNARVQGIGGAVLAAGGHRHDHR